MPTFFSVSLLTIAVVAGIAVVGWMRGRSNQLEDASNKKNDKEAVVDNNIEIVVDNEKQSLTGSAASSNRNESKSVQHTVASIGSSLSNKLSLELVNRRQYVKAVCDRFESWSSGSLESTSDEDEAAAVKAVAVNGQDAAASGNITTAFRTKPKPNNLSSFVRQCVSNIERSAIAAGALPRHTISPRNSMTSNQCESPPKSSAMNERRVPSLVAATDCDPANDHTCEDVDDESPTHGDTVTKRPLRRVLSDHATPIVFTRPYEANKAPALAPFAAIAMKTLTSNALPPVWTRVSKSETSSRVEPLASKGDDLDPEELETPIDDVKDHHCDTEPVDPSEEEDEKPQRVPMVPPPRKVSNGASRLLQFQQLVPSNQARTSVVAE